MDAMTTIAQPSKMTIYAGIFCKVWTISRAGMGLEQHAHDWPHITIVISGSVRVTRGTDIVRDYIAGDTIKIPAYQDHAFVTLTDDVQLACVHAVNRADPDALIERED